MQLPVGEPVRHPPRPVHRQRGLAHPGHPRHGRDHHRPAQATISVTAVGKPGLAEQGV